MNTLDEPLLMFMRSKCSCYKGPYAGKVFRAETHTFILYACISELQEKEGKAGLQSAQHGVTIQHCHWCYCF